MRNLPTAPALSGAAFALFYGLLGLPLLWRTEIALDLVAVSAVLAVVLAALSAIDLDRYELPNALTLPLVVLGMLVCWTGDIMPLWWSAASAALGFLLLVGVASLYQYVRGRSGLGLGDAKLFAASGAWIGAEGLPTVLLWAVGAALVTVLVASRGQAQFSATTRIPFGPFLCFGTWLVWLYGPIH